MRVVGEIVHAECKITLFYWNNRYLIKFERGLLEQTYKIQEYDVADEAALRALVNESFIQETVARFESMEQSLAQRLGELD